MKLLPQFPPLLKGYRITGNKKPVTQALSMLEKGKIGAGDILWSEDQNQLKFALVLEPEVGRERCGEMLYMLMVAFSDALGAISEPEIAINYQWPSTILLNEASIGNADLIVCEHQQDNIPLWMVLSLDIAIRPHRGERDPGLNKEQTTVWDEGCGDISRTQLLESVSRHIVNWIHSWSEDGFKPIHDQWMGKISEKIKINEGLTKAEFIGLDENGNALTKDGDEIIVLKTLDVLESLQKNSFSS